MNSMTLEWKRLSLNTPNLFATYETYSFYLTFIPVNSTLAEVMGKEYAQKQSGWIVRAVRDVGIEGEITRGSSAAKLVSSVERAKELAIKYQEQLSLFKV